MNTTQIFSVSLPPDFATQNVHY